MTARPPTNTFSRKPVSRSTVVLQEPNSPLRTIRLQFHVGSAHDPVGRKGLTYLTAALLTQGSTRKHGYTQIIEMLYPMAARVDARVDKEVSTILGTVHRDHYEAFHDLMIEVVSEPGFEPDDFQRVKTSQLNQIEKQLRANDDETLAKEALNFALYHGHPYEHPVYGHASDVRALELGDVKSHYDSVFTRENLTIGLAGELQAAAGDDLRVSLSRLPAGDPEPLDLPAPRKPDRLEALIVEKECSATAISLGFPIGVVRGDDDFYPLLIANSYLGEHRTFNGVLMNRMRGVRGLNYGDYSYIENFIQDGGSAFPLTNIPRRQQFFSIWIRPVQHENRHFALRLALWELRKLIDNGITDNDFRTTKQFLINYSRLWAQNQSRRLGHLMDSYFYGIDDFLSTLHARLEAVTVGDVNNAVRRHLDWQNVVMAAVTKDAESFLSDLSSNARSPIQYEASNMPADVMAEDKQIEAFPLTLNPDRSRTMHAYELFE